MCLIVGGEGGRRGSFCKFWDKNPQVQLIIIKEWPKNNPPILKNLDNFPLFGFLSTPTPLQLDPKEQYNRFENV